MTTSLHIIRKTKTLFHVRLPALLKTIITHVYSLLLSICYLGYYRQRLPLIKSEISPADYIHFITLGKVEFYDLLPIYTDLLCKYLVSSANHTFVSDSYDQRCSSALINNKPFRWLLLDVLNHNIPSKYVVLLHLDYFLMGPVDQERFLGACKVMDEDSSIDFIQLACNCGEVRRGSYNQDYDYLDDVNDFFFNMQVRIWRRASLCNLFVHTKYNDISSEVLFSRTSRRLGLRGLIHKLPTPPLDTCINNPIFPYISTALNARKWRRSFSEVLIPLLELYNINPEVRGWNG